MNSAGVKAYNQVSVQTDISQASPHRLIQMLIDAALQKIAIAKGLMENNQIGPKGKQIGLAISIIDGLRASLNKANGGEVAHNLGNLYDYMLQRLTEANISNDVGILDEVTNLLKPIKQAWDVIPQEIKEQHASAVLAAESTPETGNKTATG